MLAVQELLCMIRLQNCSAQVKLLFKNRKEASSPVARPALAAQQSVGDVSDKHTGQSGNYRGPQITPGQPPD